MELWDWQLGPVGNTGLDTAGSWQQCNNSWDYADDSDIASSGLLLIDT